MHKFFQIKMLKQNSQKGVTLFIAVVVTSVLLFVSFAVANIVLKATIFATSGRDSQYAYYAAEAGMECAFYWDSKVDAFATSTLGKAGDVFTLTCAGSGDMNSDQPIAGTSTLSLIGGSETNTTSIFGFVMNQVGQGSNPVSACAVVTVSKYYDGAPLVLKTHIKSRGYNTCDSSPKRVERGIETTY